MINGKILKEIPRDFVALGGVVFFALVILRVSLLENTEYLMQFVFAGIVFFILVYLFKANLHSGLGLVMLVFTIIFYNNLRFGVFASLAYLGLIASLIYLKKDKHEVFKGIILGALSSAVSYYVVDFLFN